MNRPAADRTRSRSLRHAIQLASLVALVGLACDSTEPRRAVALGVVTQPPASAQIGVTLTPVPVVELRDRDGGAFEQAGVTITASIASGGGTLDGTTTRTTGSDGRVIFNDLVVAGTTGSRTLRFSAQGLSEVTSTAIVLGPGPAAVIEATSPTAVSGTVGTALTQLPSVTVKDASGNPVPDVAVTFTVEQSVITQSTNASGVATLPATTLGGTARQYTFVATAAGVTGSVTFTVTATPDTPTHMAPSGGGQSALYGSRLPTTLTVRVTDRFGNPTPGVVVTWGSFTGAGTPEPINVATDADGIVRANYRLGTVPGENIVRASINSLSLSVDISVTALGFSNQVDVSPNHTCALDDTGVAYCWGLNSYGQLGDGTSANRSTPTRVSGTLRFRRISTSWGVTCALTTDNDPYCWGYNPYGAIGDGSKTNRFVPTPVAGGHRFTEIATGGRNTCGLTDGGAVYCWGSNQLGQLGIGTAATLSETCTDPLNPHTSYPCSLAPLSVTGGHSFASMSVGSAHVCGLTTTASELYCWGLSGAFGGMGNNNGLDPSPVRAAHGYTFEQISVAGTMTCAVDAPSTPYCWGGNSQGSLGNGDFEGSQSTPGPVSSLQAVQIDGDFGACARANDGRAFCWGFNAYGAIGDGTTTDKATPTAVATSLLFTTISASGFHTCARAENGQVHCWGQNFNGELGVGDFGGRLTPALARP
jgi:alpha-tubulin suppressor-like RCC1 family protein